MNLPISTRISWGKAGRLAGWQDGQTSAKPTGRKLWGPCWDKAVHDRSAPLRRLASGQHPPFEMRESQSQ